VRAEALAVEADGLTFQLSRAIVEPIDRQGKPHDESRLERDDTEPVALSDHGRR
jgi:hypothetical protein